MKKLILLIVFAALNGVAAWGQKPFYGEWCYKSSGELICKIWDNGKVVRQVSLVKGSDAELTMLIFGKDSLCMVSPEKKIYTVFRGDEMKKQAQKMNAFGMELETVSNSGKKEFIKSEIVSGFMCKHYKTSWTTVTKNKTTGEMIESHNMRESWETPEIRHNIQEYDSEARKILKNIVVGPQPPHLFTIPKDYKRMAGSAIMGMMKKIMAAPEENEQKMQDSRKNVDKALKGEKTSNKEANDWMDAAKKAEELLKKKK